MLIDWAKFGAVFLGSDNAFFDKFGGIFDKVFELSVGVKLSFFNGFGENASIADKNVVVLVVEVFELRKQHETFVSNGSGGRSRWMETVVAGRPQEADMIEKGGADGNDATTTLIVFDGEIVHLTILSLETVPGFQEVSVED